MPDNAAIEPLDITSWRKQRRAELIEARLALQPADRQACAELIAKALDRVITHDAGTMVSLYWPFRGEPDLRGWMSSLVARGLRVALPVVIEKARPLKFLEWTPDVGMTRGVWNIPIPAAGSPVQPDIVIAPLVGFDPHNYRLGYGGGFFDRTLAAMATSPYVIGVGYALSAMTTIHPQSHDIPMDMIITDDPHQTREAAR